MYSAFDMFVKYFQRIFSDFPGSIDLVELIIKKIPDTTEYFFSNISAKRFDLSFMSVCTYLICKEDFKNVVFFIARRATTELIDLGWNMNRLDPLIFEVHSQR